MKKFLKLVVVLLVVTILCGCGIKSEEEKIIKCISSQNNLANGYEIKSEYNIYTKGDAVKSVKTKEVVSSEQESILDYFETTLNSTYEKYNKEYGGYKYEIVKDSNAVSADVEIDYSKMDLKKFSDDNTAIKAAMNSNNELTVNGLKTMYKSLGATCED